MFLIETRTWLSQMRHSQLRLKSENLVLCMYSPIFTSQTQKAQKPKSHLPKEKIANEERKKFRTTIAGSNF